MQTLLWIWAIGSAANRLTVEEGTWRRASEYLLFSLNDLLCVGPTWPPQRTPETS